MSDIHVGLQMISVKDLTPNDIIGVLEEVAGLGYEGVEFARGFFGKTAEEIKEACDRFGLKPVSDHVFIELMREDIGAVIRNCKILEMPYIAFPGPGAVLRRGICFSLNRKMLPLDNSMPALVHP